MYIFAVFGFALGLSRAISNEWNGRISPIIHFRAVCSVHRTDTTHISLPRIMMIDKWCEEIESSRFYFFQYSFQKLRLASTYSHYSWFIFCPKLFLKGTPTLQDRAICLEMNNKCQSVPCYKSSHTSNCINPKFKTLKDLENLQLLIWLSLALHMWSKFPVKCDLKTGSVALLVSNEIV